MKTILQLRDKIIKLCGGYTYNEYKHLEVKYNKFLDEEKTDKTVQICNETTLSNLRTLENCARSLYNTPLEEWAKDMYNVIHNNYLHLAMFYLGDPLKHVIYHINPTLTTKEQLVNATNEYVKENNLIKNENV